MIRAGLEAGPHACTPIPRRIWRGFTNASGWRALISEPDLTAVLDECYAANGGDPITYFEITTCAALLAFARTPADYTLLEVGLGGRLDATNVIARPAI
jgi:dihydrofolate synthase/folylpolyglutamate synthase